jgi:hypothetical protein
VLQSLNGCAIHLVLIVTPIKMFGDGFDYVT